MIRSRIRSAYSKIEADDHFKNNLINLVSQKLGEQKPPARRPARRLLVAALAGCLVVFVAVFSWQIILNNPPGQPAASTAETSRDIPKALDLMAGIQAAAWSSTSSLPQNNVLAAMNRFSAALLEQSAKNEGNVLLSPLSVYLALAMTINGAESTTRDAMLQVLADQGISVEEIDQACKSLLINLMATGDKTTVSIANSIWFDQRFEPYQPFLRTNADYFKAGANKLDFRSATAKDTMNAWVEDATHGLIKKIIDKIDPAAAMFLINTLYFKSEWQTPFEKPEVAVKNTFTSPKGVIETEFMGSLENNIFLQYDGATGIALPYDDGQYYYFALLPDGQVQPREWMAKRDMADVYSYVNQAIGDRNSIYKVLLSLPKYKVEYDDSLKNELAGMGMEIAFEWPGADFSSMIATREKILYIGDVLHKTFFSIDEQGTEAGAATVVEMYFGGMPSYAHEVILNRPFIYGIIDQKTGTVLFAGIMENPAG